jgi:hypothetical protein
VRFKSVEKGAKTMEHTDERERDPEDKGKASPVRDAGPENMENPPEEWDGVDEEGDESFPASDPPANY